MKKVILLTILMIVLASCRDSTVAQFTALGEDSKIELVNADGSVIHSWISSGKVKTEETSDGYYFMDKATGKLVRVTGNLIITVAEPGEKIIVVTPYSESEGKVIIDSKPYEKTGKVKTTMPPMETEAAIPY